METVRRSDSDEKDRNDHSHHGQGGFGQGHEAEGPDKCQRHTGERQQKTGNISKEKKEKDSDNNEGDGGKMEKILLGEVGQGL